MGGVCGSEKDVAFPEPSTFATRVKLQNGNYFIGKVNDEDQPDGEGVRYNVHNRPMAGGTWQKGAQHGAGYLLDDNCLDRYEGNFEHGQPHGEGSKEWKSGSKLQRGTYKGTWKDGKRHGAGTMTFASSSYSSFVGQWVKDDPKMGLLSHRDGESFDGNFKAQFEWNGAGIEWTAKKLVRRVGTFGGDPTAWFPTYTPGSVSRTELGWPEPTESIEERWSKVAEVETSEQSVRLADIIWPHSQETRPSGSEMLELYIGETKSNKRQGKGRMFYGRKDTRGDTWDEDMQQGPVGYRKFGDGHHFKGGFVKDKFHGEGVMTHGPREGYLAGAVAKGSWAQGLLEGNATIDYDQSATELKKFEGVFKNDLRHTGLLTFQDGRTWKGDFAPIAPINQRANGIMKYPNGQTAEGDWLSDDFVKGLSRRVCVRLDASGRLLYSGAESDQCTSPAAAAVLRSSLRSWPAESLVHRESVAASQGANVSLADLILSPDTFYIGYLGADSEPAGKGILYIGKQAVAGELWQNGVLHHPQRSTGFRRYPNGNEYTGEFVNGLRQGQGEIKFAPNSAHGMTSYKGTFEKDLMAPNATSTTNTLLFENGNKWCGQLANPKVDPKAKPVVPKPLPLEVSTGQRLANRVFVSDMALQEYDNDMRIQGIGILTLPDGSRKEGTFAEGGVLTAGIVFDKDGKMTEIGRFQDGQAQPNTRVLRTQLPWVPATPAQLAQAKELGKSGDIHLANVINFDGSFFVGTMNSAFTEQNTGEIFDKDGRLISRVRNGVVEDARAQGVQAQQVKVAHKSSLPEGHFDVFLSHVQTESKNIVKKMYAQLSDANYRCSVDKEGGDEDEKLLAQLQAVRQSRRFIFVLSSTVLESASCLSQLREAMKSKVPVVVVRDEDVKFGEDQTSSPPESMIPEDLRELLQQPAVEHPGDTEKFIKELVTKLGPPA